MTWFPIGTIDDIPQRGARCVVTPQGKIGVFRTHNDRIFAIEDHCPHKGGPLADGQIDDSAVVCPLHQYSFSFDTGACAGRGVGSVRIYPVRVNDGRILLAPFSTK